MPRPRVLSISIRTPWVPVRLPKVRAGPAVLVGGNPAGAPIGGLLRPVRAMPCPYALLAKTIRLTMSNHGALTPIYYGKSPDSENSKNRLRGTPLSLGSSHPYPGGLQLICCFRVQGSDPPKASKFRDGEGAIRPNQATNCTGSACPTIGPRWKSRFFLCATMLNSKFPMATSAKKLET